MYTIPWQLTKILPDEKSEIDQSQLETLFLE